MEATAPIAAPAIVLSALRMKNPRTAAVTAAKTPEPTKSAARLLRPRVLLLPTAPRVAATESCLLAANASRRAAFLLARARLKASLSGIRLGRAAGAALDGAALDGAAAGCAGTGIGAAEASGRPETVHGGDVAGGFARAGDRAGAGAAGSGVATRRAGGSSPPLSGQQPRARFSAAHNFRKLIGYGSARKSPNSPSSPASAFSVAGRAAKIRNVLGASTATRLSTSSPAPSPSRSHAMTRSNSKRSSREKDSALVAAVSNLTSVAKVLAVMARTLAFRPATRTRIGTEYTRIEPNCSDVRMRQSRINNSVT